MAENRRDPPDYSPPPPQPEADEENDSLVSMNSIHFPLHDIYNSLLEEAEEGLNYELVGRRLEVPSSSPRTRRPFSPSHQPSRTSGNGRGGGPNEGANVASPFTRTRTRTPPNESDRSMSMRRYER